MVVVKKAVFVLEKVMKPEEYLKDNKDKRLSELFEFLKFQSISGRSEHKDDVLACADWLNDHLNNIG